MVKDYGAVQGNTEKRKKNITVSIIILALLLLIEIYLMINFPRGYIFLALIGVAALFLVYRIVKSVFIIQEERDSKREKEFESIFKSEKASYLLMRKNFAEIGEMIYLLKGDSGLPLEELISAQKSIAKVTINKNKEHFTSVIQSNEELKGNLLEINEKFAEIQNSVKENMEKVSELVGNEIQSKNLDVILRLNDLEKSINSELEEKIHSIQTSTHVMMEPKDLSILHDVSEESESPQAQESEEIQIPEIEGFEEEPEEIQMPEIEELKEEPEEIQMPEIEELKEEPEEIQMPEIEELKEEPEEIQMPEIEELKEEPEEIQMPEIEELKEEPEEIEIPELEMPELENFEPRPEPLTDNLDTGEFGDLEEKVRELQKIAAEEEPEISSLEVEKNQEDLSSLIEQVTPSEGEVNHKMTPEEIEKLLSENEEEEFVPEIDLSNVSEDIPSMEEIDKMLASIPMPVEHTEPEKVSDPDDFSHVMTPDEVAALIGEATAEQKNEPAPEPEPEISAASGDSNHVMTPDEIAALLASV